jgi:hypothetical protein
MWRRQALAASTSQREGLFLEAIVWTVVLPVAVVVLAWLSLEPAAAAAVAMPANASRSPQARMERRNF